MATVNVPEHGWRVGRKVGRTLYEDDELIGVMDTRELAAEVVAAVRRLAAVLDLHRPDQYGRCSYCRDVGNGRIPYPCLTADAATGYGGRQ
jgi:hypothetical protein